MILTAWIILGLCIGVIVFTILSKIPVISSRVVGRSRILMLSDTLVGYINQKFKAWLTKVWHFILEAKDLKPQLPISRLVHMHPLDTAKKAFRIRIRQSDAEPAWLPEAVALDPAETVVDMEQRYLKLIKDNPKDMQAYEGLARLYLQEKNYAEAQEAFDYLTKLNPSRDVYWSNLGLSLFSLKQFRQAAEAYQKALDLNSKIPVRWINLALCFDSMDEISKSIRAIIQALELDPRNINYQFLLADMYMKVQNKVRAEEVLEKILQIEPTNKPAREKLMKIRI